MARFLDDVHVVGLAGQVELRHEEGVRVPEFVFDQPATHLLEPHADELGFDQVEELPVGMLLAGRDAGRLQADCVFSKAFVSPTAIFQHLWRKKSYLISCSFFKNLLNNDLAGFHYAEPSALTFIHTEGLACLPSL